MKSKQFTDADLNLPRKDQNSHETASPVGDTPPSAITRKAHRHLHPQPKSTWVMTEAWKIRSSDNEEALALGHVS